MSGSDQEAEPGARLTCHLLLRLFSTFSLNNLLSLTTSKTSGSTISSTTSVKLSCDKHLLQAAHSSINVGAVVAVLKALLMLGKFNVSFSEVIFICTLLWFTILKFLDSSSVTK